MLIKRPFVWIFGILLCFFLLFRFVYGKQMDKHYYCLDSYSGKQAVLGGIVEHIDEKPKSFYLFLKNVSVRVADSTQIFSFSDFLIITDKNQGKTYSSGNGLQIKGVLSSFSNPSGPGQFNEKAYYKEKNIYYKMAAEKIWVCSEMARQPNQFLYQLRSKFQKVYAGCMEEKEAGILSAMLLGEKSLLDADVKSLYQSSGISHILAISGLHITILCTLLYQLMIFLGFPRPCPFLATTVFLICYGIMTGFGIATSRAIYMMFLLLLARETGRSYDAPTAMAFSAVIILLQKPYALFSCSFLLSYGAMAGVYIVYPAFKLFLFGKTAKKCRKPGKFERFLTKLREKLVTSLLFNLSIWLATLPVMLYFFYEIPTYGILINLMVLPFLPVLVVLSLFGGIAGLFCLPLAEIFLFPASLILACYEKFCTFALKLPQPVQVLGCPSGFSVFLYYLLLLMLVVCIYLQLLQKGKFPVAVFCLSVSFFVLLYHAPVPGLRITMLDVGQGDGILIESRSGEVILIDGGSSSISGVGQYRILPHLKYYGIRKIDYLLMTHPDEDHISGQRELMQKNGTGGIRIENYLIPKLAEKLQDTNYHSMKELAIRQKIPVSFIRAGDTLVSSGLKLLCLHPEPGFDTDSANACSVTLQLSYQSFSMLLTGDLEKEGEEAVVRKLKGEKQAQVAPSSRPGFTVLKVAHHGSKNSTCGEFLSLVNPMIVLISCGERNRYGHPHRELLERLKDAGSAIYQTPEHGVIQITTDGSRIQTDIYKGWKNICDKYISICYNRNDFGQFTV